MQRTPADHEMITTATAEMKAHPARTIVQVIPPRRMTTALIFLSGCIALLMAGFGMIVPVFPRRLEALGLGVETLALMESAFGLGMLLFSTPLGLLADRIGRKPIVLLSLAGFIVTNVLLTLVNIPLAFLLIRFLEGMLVSGLMPASMAMVGDSVPREKQRRWIGLITAAQALGFALGPAIGGFLSQIWGFSSPFLIAAAIAFIASLLAMLLLPETLSAHVQEHVRLHRDKKHHSKKASHDSSPRISLGLGAFIPLLIIDGSVTFIYPFVLPQYPFFFTRVLGYSTAQFGIMVSVYGLALATFPMLLIRLGEDIPTKRLILLGSLLYPALNVGMLFLHQYVLLLGAAMVTGIGNALLIPALNTLYLRATTERHRSQVMGIRGTAISVGTFLGPLIQALASSWITPQMTFAIAVMLSFVITLFAFIMLKR